MRPWRMVLTAVILTVAAASEPAEAEDARADWRALNGQVVEAYQEGRYTDGIALAEKAYQFARQAFGPKDPATLSSMNNLAGLYESRGRLSEAEPLYVQALALSRELLDEHHPFTLTTMNNLASLYESQNRLSEAEPLYVHALALRLEMLGERHLDTLTSMNNLAFLYMRRGRYGEAEPLFVQAFTLYPEVLGEHHPATLTSMSNLAALYVRQGRYGEAESLFAQTLALRHKVLGERHPATLTSMNNLASLYASQGRHDAAEPLYAQTLTLAREALGERHPDMLTLSLNAAGNFAALGRGGDAVQLLRQAEPGVLSWLGVELYASEDVARRGSIVASQANFQDMALSVAVAFPDADAAQRLAASSLLRSKGLIAEEEAYLARLSRSGEDQRIRQAAETLQQRRQELAAASHGSASPEQIESLVRQMNEAEVGLGRQSRVYDEQLQVTRANLEALQGALGDRVLVEYRRYRRADFNKGLAEARWAAVVVEGPDRVRVKDLGEVGDTAELVATAAATGTEAEAAARTLYDRLIAPLQLPASGQEVVIAPDDALFLLNFAQLTDPQGKTLAQTTTLRLIQTSRDLLRPASARPAQGLLALGGIAFGQPPAQLPALASDAFTRPRGSSADLRAAAAGNLQDGFDELPFAGFEVNRIDQLYRIARPDETAAIWTADQASEERLKHLSHPPRILHLATHGFYRPPRDQADRPMLLAGVALAGANLALATADQDGILYAIEAQDLNLEGTELVVLSACETGQGQTVSGEGVYGLVRALRTAGARNVLVTLRPIGDASAPKFMEAFYRNLLRQPQGHSDPSKAFQATQRDFIQQQPSFDWLPYVLFGA